MPRNRSRSGSRDRDRKKDKDRERDREKHRDRKDKEKEKEKEKDRDRRHSPKSRRSRSRSRSPPPPARDRHRTVKKSSGSPSPLHKSKRERHRSPSPHDSYLTLGNVKPKGIGSVKAPIILDPLALEGKTEEEIEMMKLMGFSGFDSTKGKHIDDGKCNAYAVNVQQKRKYRQYMNRKGGFNRPLDPVA